jgi:F-type H+-transporting ATPase subunit b
MSASVSALLTTGFSGFSGSSGFSGAHGMSLLSAAAGGVEVDVNFTLVLMQLGVVTVLMLVLKPVLFEPLLALFEEREKRIDGAKLDARKMDDQAAEMLRKYESEIEKVTRLAGEERDKVRAEAQRLEAQVLAEAREATAKLLEQGRKEIAAERAAAVATLSENEVALTRQIAGTVLGRELS